jgi:hypothetical protein
MTVAEVLASGTVQEIAPGDSIESAIERVGSPDGPADRIAGKTWSYRFGQMTLLVEDGRLFEIELDFERAHARCWVGLGDWSDYDHSDWCRMGEAQGARLTTICEVTVLGAPRWRVSLSAAGRLHRVVLFEVA